MEYYYGASMNKNEPTFVTRQAHKDLIKEIKKGQKCCCVFNANKTGKSSLKAGVAQDLKQEGYICLFEDLSVKQANLEENSFYKSIAEAFSDNLFEQNILISVDINIWWEEDKSSYPLEKFKKFIKNILLVEIPKEQKIICFFDEINDIVNQTKFSTDQFFNLISYFYNEKATNPEYNRLNFCLLGVITPSSLIKNTSTKPFNIDHNINLKGFCLEEIREPFKLKGGLFDIVGENDYEFVLNRVLSWTGGQPFFTQKLCQLIVNEFNNLRNFNLKLTIEQTIEKIVQENIINDWSSEDKDSPKHLRTIQEKFYLDKTKTNALLGLYEEILNKGSIKVDTNNKNQEFLRIMTGLVREENGKLVVANRIYEKVFNNDWIQQIRSSVNPWAKKIEKWHGSEKKDKSLLLTGDELGKILEFASERSLSKNEYDFISACQQEEIEIRNREAQDADSKRIEAEKQEKIAQKMLIMSIIGLIVTVIIGGFFIREKLAQANQNLNEVKSDLDNTKKTNDRFKKQNNNLIISIEDKDEKIESLNQQKEILNKNIARQKKQVQNLNEETENLTQDNKLLSQKNNLLAKNNQILNNNLENKDRELQEVEITLNTKNSQLNQTREKLETKQQNLLQTENDLEKANQELLIAKEVTAIETKSSQILEDFEFRQLDSLLAATKLAQRLKKLVKNEQDWRNYSTTKPLTNLQYILLNISEFNQLKYQDSVKKIIFSPDGKIFATLTEKEIKVHQENGVEIDTIKLKDDYKVRDIAFDADENLIVIAIKNISINVIKNNNREAIGVEFISEIEVNTWNKDRIISQKNITIKTRDKNEEDMWGNYIYNMIISPNGEKIATIHQNNKVRLWNLDGSLITTFSITEAENSTSTESNLTSKDMKFSPDSTRIAIRYRDNQIKIWKLDKNNQITLDKVIDGKDYFKNIKRYETPHSLLITDVTFSPQSQYLTSNFLLFALRHDGRTQKGFPITESFIGIYDLEKAQYVPPPGLPNQKRPSIINSTSEIQPTIVVGYEDGNIDTFAENLAMNGEWTQGLSFKAHTGSIDNLASNANGLIISTDSNGNIKLITQGKLGYYNRYFNYAHGSLWYKGLDQIYDPKTNKTLRIYGNQDGNIRIEEFIYNKDGKPESNVLDTLEHGEPVLAVSISPNSKSIISSSFQSLKIWSWDEKKGTLIKTVNTNFERNISPIFTLVFHPDSQKFVSGSVEGDIIIWDKKGKILKIIKTERKIIYSISISPDGKTIASGGMDGVIQLWDEDGRLLKTYHRHKNEIDNIAFSNDGKLIISSSIERINIWNREGETLASYPNDARSNVAFDNDTQGFNIDKGYGTYMKISFNLNGLIQQSCAWLDSYLTTHLNDPQAKEIRKICDSKK